MYRKILEDPTLPPGLIFNFRVLPGGIVHHGAQFKAVKSLYKDDRYYSEKAKSNVFLLDESIQTSVTTVVEETDDAFLLNVFYRILYSTRITDTYSTFLNPEILLDILREIIEMWACSGGCQPLNNLERVSTEHSLWRNSSAWTIKVEPNSMKITQDILNQVREPAEKWMLTCSRSLTPYKFNRIFTTESDSFTMMVNNPFILYLYLNDRPSEYIALFPYMTCLSCSIELGYWTKCYSHFFSHYVDTITDIADLITPGNNTSMIRWELTTPAKEPYQGNDNVHPSHLSRD